MRMLNIKAVVACAVCLLASPWSASAANDDFRQWMQQEQQTFQEYKDKRDKEFTSFLKSQWKELEVFSGIKRDEVPKPVVMPVAKPKPKPKPKPVEKPTDAKPVAPKPKPRPVVVKKPPVVPTKPPVPVIPPVISKAPKGRAADILFYGNRLKFFYDPAFVARVKGRINADAISGFWSTLSKADYDTLLTQLDAQRKPLQLNDWGYALLANEISKQIYNGRNERTLFTWFMMIKAGYQARISYSSNQVFLLLPTKQRLYSVAYFTFDGVRYYAVDLDGNKARPGKVFTYDGQYPGAVNKVNMQLDRALNTRRDTRNRKVNFSYNGKAYRVDIKYDKNTINYLRTYPQMDIGMYFTSYVNEDIGNPLLQQLRPMLEGQSEEEAVNILLRFVQNAFKYKTDENQFGEENYLFAEETMFYPYSDCEDRSILFAWLVRSLLGLDVVGLDFPGHIAAAVRFSQPVSGDAVTYKGKKYTVTDPTYINATAGMTMPNYKKHKPGVIPIRAL